MKRGYVRLGCRIAVLLWASLWMLAIPLFHVHPAVNHRHGGAVHTYGITVHTVLSSDLVGEFEDHHEDGRPEADASRVSLFDHHSHSLDQHPEIDFSLLNDSGERKGFKPFLAPAFALHASLVSHVETEVRTETLSTPVHTFTSFLYHIPARAPPLLLS